MVQSGTTNIPGRVWTDYYQITQDTPTLTNGVDIRLWYITPDGYIYDTTYAGYNGQHSAFFSNATGNVTTGTCDSVYRSVEMTDTTVDSDMMSIYANCGGNHLFFEEPDASMPETATT